MTDEAIRLILEVAGQEGIDALAKSTANYRADCWKSLRRSSSTGDVSAEEFKAQTRKSSARNSTSKPGCSSP